MPASVAPSEIEDEENRHQIHDVDDLSNHGINKVDIDRLKTNGMHTIGVCSLTGMTPT